MSAPNRYLDEVISYGEELTRAEVIADMQSQGTPQPLIDRWLQGQELMAEIQRRRAADGPRTYASSGTPPSKRRNRH